MDVNFYLAHALFNMIRLAFYHRHTYFYEAPLNPGSILCSGMCWKSGPYADSTVTCVKLFLTVIDAALHGWIFVGLMKEKCLEKGTCFRDY